MTPIDLDAVVLSAGAHHPDSGAYCVEELVAALAGEPWSDRPQCACPVIAAYARGLNDQLPDAERQRLVPYALRQIGTRSTPEVEQRRGYLCADWAVRVFAPIALRSAGRTTEANRLAALPPIVNRETAHAASAAADADAAAYAAYAAASAVVAAGAAAAADAADAAAAAADAVSAGVVDQALALFDALLAVTA